MIFWTASVWPDGDVTWCAWLGDRRLGCLHRQPDGSWLATRSNCGPYASRRTLRAAAWWLVKEEA